jgi:hypothetical protein
MTERSNVSPSVVESTRIKRGELAIALLGACASAGVLLASAAAATAPAARACPSSTAVNKALGMHVRTAVASHYLTYSKTCTYPGGIGLTKITFQTDTTSTFAASEKAAEHALGAKLIHKLNLSQGAWTTNAGDLYVFDGHETIKVLAPGIATAKLEAFVKTLL